MGVLNQNLFTMIVTMAVVTTMAMPPMLRAALNRLPISNDEKERLDREAFEAKGFVSNLERILLAVDESPNGRFAARLAGLLAGRRGMPTTVMHIGENAEKPDARDGQSPEAHVRAGAATTAAQTERKEDARPDRVDVLTKSANMRTEDAVATEARKGYDLMFIGIEISDLTRGGYNQEITKIANGFEGPLAIVVGRGRHLERPRDSTFRILAPITGTDASRRAAEVAVALAHSIDASISALYVTETRERRNADPISRTLSTRRREEGILKDFVELSERYGISARTSVRMDEPPQDVILHQARSGQFDLIVLGVNRRAGEELYFGKVATAVLDNSTISVLLVSGGSTAGVSSNSHQEA